MADKLDDCEKELRSLLDKINNARDCLLNAIGAVEQAKSSINAIPQEIITKGDFGALFSNLLGQINVLTGQNNKASSNEMPSAVAHQSHSTTPEAVPTNIVEKTGTKTVAEKTPTAPLISAQTESHAQPIWSEDVKERSLDDLQPWVGRKDLFMRVTCSLLPDGTFWCVPEYGVERDYLKIISDRLRKLTMLNKELWKVDTSNKNQMVCVLSKLHSLWLRAVIEKKVSDTDVILRYIDIGKTEKVQENRINGIPDDLKNVLPLALCGCFQKEPFTASYDMKWKFKDLTDKKTLAVEVKEEIKDGCVSRYVVSLKGPEDAEDIGELICGELKAQGSITASVLPSKDVRFYGDSNGSTRGQLSMIRDIHSYKDESGGNKENEVKDEKSTSNEKGSGDDSKKESKENAKDNKVEKVKPESPLKIEVVDVEGEGTLAWGDMCKTPDVNNQEEMEFLPLKELEIDPDEKEPAEDQSVTANERHKVCRNITVENDHPPGSVEDAANEHGQSLGDCVGDFPKDHATNGYPPEEEHPPVNSVIGGDSSMRENPQSVGIPKETEINVLKDSVKESVLEKASNGDIIIVGDSPNDDQRSKDDGISPNLRLELEAVKDKDCAEDVFENDDDDDIRKSEQIIAERLRAVADKSPRSPEAPSIPPEGLSNSQGSPSAHPERSSSPSIPPQRSSDSHESPSIPPGKDIDESRNEVDETNLECAETEVAGGLIGFSNEVTTSSDVNGTGETANYDEATVAFERAAADGDCKVAKADDQQTRKVSEVSCQSEDLAAPNSNHVSESDEVTSQGSAEAEPQSRQRGFGVPSEVPRVDKRRQKDVSKDLNTHAGEDIEKWRKEQLKGLGSRVLDNHNAKYFVLETRNYDLMTSYKTGRFYMPDNPLLWTAMGLVAKEPIVLFFVNEREHRQICALGNVASPPTKFMTRGKETVLFGVNFISKAKARKLCTFSYRPGDELKKNTAMSLLGQYAGFIRQGFVDKVLDEVQIVKEMSSKAKSAQKPQEQAPWAKFKQTPPPSPNRDHEASKMAKSVAERPVKKDRKPRDEKEAREYVRQSSSSSDYEVPPRLQRKEPSHQRDKGRKKSNSKRSEKEAAAEKETEDKPAPLDNKPLTIEVNAAGNQPFSTEPEELWSPTLYRQPLPKEHQGKLWEPHSQQPTHQQQQQQQRRPPSSLPQQLERQNDNLPPQRQFQSLPDEPNLQQQQQQHYDATQFSLQQLQMWQQQQQLLLLQQHSQQQQRPPSQSNSQETLQRQLSDDEIRSFYACMQIQQQQQLLMQQQMQQQERPQSPQSMQPHSQIQHHSQIEPRSPMQPHSQLQSRSQMMSPPHNHTPHYSQFESQSQPHLQSLPHMQQQTGNFFQNPDGYWQQPAENWDDSPPKQLDRHKRSDQHRGPEQHNHPLHGGSRGPSRKTGGIAGSCEDFGSDDEPERDLKKECDVFGLSAEDFNG